MKLLFLTLSALIALSQAYINHGRMNDYGQRVYDIPYQWKQLEFGFPNEQAKQEAKADGNLVPAHAIPIDVQPDYNGKRMFVTVPRFLKGVPYTLATVSNKLGNNGPLLQPYPSYEANNNRNGTNCDAITSAFRVAITECNQMWVIDSGLSPDAHCPPQLILFDLKTDKIIHRYRFITSLYTPGVSMFINPVVNVRNPAPHGDCSNTMVYVADANYHGLVVYDYKQNNAWRIENRYMYPNPNNGLLTVAGESFIIMDGIFGLATDRKNLYFHPLASETEYFVPLSVIDNSTLFESGNRYQDFKPLGNRASQCTVSAIDKNNNLYCVNLNPAKLTSWNVNKRLNKSNINYLKVDSKVLEFVSGMKIVKNDYGLEELWILSNRFQKMALGTQNFQEVNFRIVVVPLEKEVENNIPFFEIKFLIYQRQ